MRRGLPVRFWIEAAVAVAGVALLVLTFLVPDWFERAAALSPDGGDGSYELVLPAALLLVSAASGLAARRRYGRLSPEE